MVYLGRKGISPLIAAVLLIVITMVISAIIAFWASSFVRSSLDTVQSSFNCPLSDFEIYSSSYDNSTEELRLLLRNTGGFPLNVTVVDFIYSNDQIQTSTINLALPTTGIHTFTLSNIQDGFSRYIIATNCPELTKEV